MATVVNGVDIEHFHLCRKFYWKVPAYYIYISAIGNSA